MIPTMEDLHESIVGIEDLVEDRNRLMRFMFNEDQHDDFLMAEKLQDMGNAGGVHVQPIKGGSLDLSPINNLLPNLAMGQSPEPIVKNFTTPSTPENPRRSRGLFGGRFGGNRNNNNSGNSNNNPTQNFAKGGILSGITTGSPVSSLADMGLDDTFEKNITNKLEDDFKISDKLKNAFGDAMALPVRAAAALLTDLISSLPVTTEAQKTFMNDNLSQITNAFHLNKNTFQSDSTDDQTTGTTFNNQELLNSVVGDTLISQTNNSERLNIFNPFNWTNIMNEADKARKGERPDAGDHELSVPGNILKWHQRNAEYMEMLSFNNTSNNDTIKVVNNIMSSLSAEVPSIVTTANNIVNQSSIVPVTDTVVNNLTELTDNVINETRLNKLEKTELARNSSVTVPPIISDLKTIAKEMQIGSNDGMPKIKESIFLDLYTTMSQFS
tara:strand:+ start:104 stop:1423 length:1320 start_codon:yes stop_codon:yes gene_type:complete